MYPYPRGPTWSAPGVPGDTAPLRKNLRRLRSGNMVSPKRQHGGEPQGVLEGLRGTPEGVLFFFTRQELWRRSRANGITTLKALCQFSQVSASLNQTHAMLSTLL